MTEPLGRITVSRRSGSERFTDGAQDPGFDLLGFWQGSASDQIGNTARAVLAEYPVAKAINFDVSGVREPWSPHDICTCSGLKVEVKSSSYLQSWHQTKPSTVTFGVPKTRPWHPDTNIFAKGVSS